MQINVEVLEGLERKITVMIPSEQIDQTVEKKLQSLIGKASMPGFREGKVPAKLVRQKYAGSVRGEVVSEMLGSSYREAVQKESLRPASMPRMNLIKNEAGHPIEYEAVFEVYPAIDLKNLDSVEIEHFKVEISDEDVDNIIQNTREQRAKWNVVDRAAKAQDLVEIDFESFIDGESFEGGSGTNVRLILGSESAIPGFEEGVIGAKAGDKLSLSLTFPSDFPRENVAGKETETKITVHKVLESELPALDDTFFEALGIKTGGLEALKAQVRDNLQKEVERADKGRMKSQVMEKFLAINKIDVPRALVDEEIERLRHDMAERLSKNKQRLDPAALSNESFEASAVRRVSLGLLFAEFIKANEIKLDRDRVEQVILDLVSYTGVDAEAALQWYRNNDQEMQTVEASVIEEQVVDALLKQATLVERACAYDDFMKVINSHQH